MLQDVIIFSRILLKTEVIGLRRGQQSSFCNHIGYLPNKLDGTSHQGIEKF